MGRIKHGYLKAPHGFKDKVRRGARGNTHQEERVMELYAWISGRQGWRLFHFNNLDYGRKLLRDAGYCTCLVKRRPSSVTLGSFS